jgi:hypothetical protein
MRHVAIEAEHPSHDCERWFVFARIAVKSDSEGFGTHLTDASGYDAVRGVQRPDIMSVRCQDIDEICRQAAQRAYSEVESERSGDRDFMPRV